MLRFPLLSFFLLPLCMLLGILEVHSNIPPKKRLQPLQLLPADSLHLYDFYWASWVDSARVYFPTLSVHPYQPRRYTKSQWKQATNRWQRRTSDSLNLVGGIAPLSAVSQVPEALKTVKQSLPLYLHSADARYFEAIDYALHNTLRGALSKVYPEAQRIAAAQVANQLGQFFAATDDSTLYLNLWANCILGANVGGKRVRLEMVNSYPWYGMTKISVYTEQPGERLRIAIRIPLWAQGKTLASQRYLVDNNRFRYMVSIGDKQCSTQLHRGYVIVDHQWQPNDILVINLALPTQIITPYAPPAATTTLPSPIDIDSVRYTALRRGPLVYALDTKVPQPPSLRYERDIIRFHFDPTARHAYILDGKLYTADTDTTGKPCEWSPYYIVRSSNEHKPLVWVATAPKP